MYALKRAARGSLEIQDAKMTQKNRHMRTIAQLCRAVSSKLRHLSTTGKNLLNSDISAACHNMMNFGALSAEIDWRVCGTPANFNRFRAWLRYCSDVAHRRPTKLCTMFSCLLGCYTIHTFSGILAPDRILPGAKFNLRTSLAFSYIGTAN